MSRSIGLDGVRSALVRAPVGELERPERAAVAIVLAPSLDDSSRLSVLLMRRSERQGDPWSGHMAFPGGRAQSTDADLLHTARRETLEEVGIDLTGSELLGRLDDVSPMRSSALVVRPFVFWAEQQPRASLSEEVTEVLWVALEELANAARRSSREVEVNGAKLRVPAFVIDERVVWGMTFRLLERFLALVQAVA